MPISEHIIKLLGICQIADNPTSSVCGYTIQVPYRFLTDFSYYIQLPLYTRHSDTVGNWYSYINTVQCTTLCHLYLLWRWTTLFFSALNMNHAVCVSFCTFVWPYPLLDHPFVEYLVFSFFVLSRMTNEFEGGVWRLNLVEYISSEPLLLILLCNNVHCILSRLCWLCPNTTIPPPPDSSLDWDLIPPVFWEVVDVYNFESTTFFVIFGSGSKWKMLIFDKWMNEQVALPVIQWIWNSLFISLCAHVRDSSLFLFWWKCLCQRFRA